MPSSHGGASLTACMSSRASTATEPAHVHVEREDSTCKFWLEPIELARSHGFGVDELNVVRRIINTQLGRF